MLTLIGWRMFGWIGELEKIPEGAVVVEGVPTRIIGGGERTQQYTFHGHPPPSPLPPPPLHQQQLPAPPILSPSKEIDKYLPPLSLKPPSELLFPLSRPRRSSATIVLPVTSLPEREQLDDTLASLLDLTSTGVVLACSSELVEPLEEYLKLGIELELESSANSNATEEDQESLVVVASPLSKVLVVAWSNTYFPPFYPSTEHDQSHALPLLHLLVNLHPSQNNQTFLILPSLSSLLSSSPSSSLPSTLRPLLSYPTKRSHQTSNRPPLFLRGARISASSILPVSSGEEEESLVPVAFGVPPMLIGSKLLRRNVEGMRIGGGEMGVWAALGERMVVIGGGEVGGWVVPPPHRRRESNESSSSSKEEMEQLLHSQLPSNPTPSASTSHQSFHQALFSPTPLSDRGRVGLVLPSLDALDVLGSLACALLRTGHRVDIRIPSLVVEEERGEVVRGGGCWLRYQGGRVDDEEGGRRTKRKGVDVIIVGGEGMEPELDGIGMEREVRIVVPERDLEVGGGGEEIWDWVGTLGISLLKSEFLSLISFLSFYSLAFLPIYLLDANRLAHTQHPTQHHHLLPPSLPPPSPHLPPVSPLPLPYPSHPSLHLPRA